MKRQIITYLAMTAVALSSVAQQVTYNHDSPKMNQFTVAEIGTGGLTPALYYDLLHKKYQQTAAQKNKLSFRTTAGIASYWQVDDATKLDSAMIKRAEIEALNMADRSGGAADVAWIAEGEKINKKLSDLNRNINRIIPYGGSPKQKQMWVESYNMFQTAIKATREAYMPNSQRKKQYLQIYADAARANETVVKFLVYLSTGKKTSELLSSTNTIPNKNAEIAAAAMGRWREAGWSASQSDDDPPKFHWDKWPNRPWDPINPSLKDSISIRPIQ